eukprot:3203479-Pyramimonas_sp.AAC.1
MGISPGDADGDLTCWLIADVLAACPLSSALSGVPVRILASRNALTISAPTLTMGICSSSVAAPLTAAQAVVVATTSASGMPAPSVDGTGVRRFMLRMNTGFNS